MLLQLTDAQLRDSFGIASYGHRTELLAEIEREKRHAVNLTAFPPLRGPKKRESDASRQALKVHIEVDCSVKVVDGSWTVSFKSNPHMIPGAARLPLGATLSGASKFEYVDKIRRTIYL